LAIEVEDIAAMFDAGQNPVKRIVRNAIIRFSN